MTPEQREQLKADEGLRFKPYYDTATPPKLSIGYARNLTDRGISQEEADYMLDNDLADIRDKLDPKPWFSELDAVRQGVIVNMAYNMGVAKLMTFHYMIQALDEKNYEIAALEMERSLWYRVQPRRSDRLIAQMRGGTITV